MSKQKRMIVTIEADGQVSVKAEGVSGKACQDFTRTLESALGEVISDVPTPEMREREERQYASDRQS